jgi:hypothetical protein
MKSLLVAVSAALVLASCACAPKAVPTQESVAQMLRRVGASTVQVEDDNGFGSGTVIGKGLVLTCSHVVTPRADNLQVIYFGLKLHATVVKEDPAADLALLSVPGLPTWVQPVPVAAVDPAMFDMLWSLTYPMAMPLTAAEEILDGQGPRPGTWRVTGFALPGSSGGAMVDRRGVLVCVVEATWNGLMAGCIHRGAVSRFLAP